MRALRAIAGALAYFTVLPLPSTRNEAPDADAVAVLPFIGALVGALAGSAGYFAGIVLPGYGALTAWIVAIGLTGAMHVDGFLDCCDALFASVVPQRRLEILRDPRHGTFAVAGMVMLAFVWVTALSSLPPTRLPVDLAFAAALGRLAAIANAWVFPYARSDGTHPMLAVRPNAALAAASVALVVLLAWLIAPFALVLVPVALVAGLLLGWFAARRLGGGITGDVYGAVAVVVEAGILVALRR